MTAYSPTSTPSNIISICSGNVAQLLDLDEVQQQASFQITSWASPNSTHFDGVYLTGDF